jgi:hypothetical protein
MSKLRRAEVNEDPKTPVNKIIKQNFDQPSAYMSREQRAKVSSDNASVDLAASSSPNSNTYWTPDTFNHHEHIHNYAELCSPPFVVRETPLPDPFNSIPIEHRNNEIFSTPSREQVRELPLVSQEADTSSKSYYLPLGQHGSVGSISGNNQDLFCVFHWSNPF